MTPPATREIARQALSALPDWTVPQYDSTTSYYVKDPATLGALTSDPDWLALEAEAGPYEDISKGTIVCGYETVELDTASFWERVFGSGIK